MEENLENRKIEIDQETLNQLNTARKWAMFLAITGFIFLGLIIVIGLIAGTFLTAFNSGGQVLGIPEWLMFVLILLLAAIYFFPVFFLFRFSKHASHAIKTLDKQEFHKAIKSLKSFFTYIGIFLIVILSSYFVLLIVAGSSMVFF